MKMKFYVAASAPDLTRMLSSSSLGFRQEGGSSLLQTRGMRTKVIKIRIHVDEHPDKTHRSLLSANKLYHVALTRGLSDGQGEVVSRKGLQLLVSYSLQTFYLPLFFLCLSISSRVKNVENIESY